MARVWSFKRIPWTGEMADQKPSTKYYQLKGVNQKNSKYEFPEAEVLALYNLDFDVPNAWQKRPGSTFSIDSAQGTSGPISALFEFSKLNGTSYIVAASDTALFYIANNGLTLLAGGWNNGQPVDMLTFVNKMYAANGQNFGWFDGTSFLPAGLPAQKSQILSVVSGSLNGTFWTVAGATALQPFSSATFLSRAVYVAYAYLRSDGYVGPADFLQNARNIIKVSPSSGAEWFNTFGGGAGALIGLTIPSGSGISAIAVYIATDTTSNTGATAFVSTPFFGGTGAVQFVGNLGFYVGAEGGVRGSMSMTLIPNADVSRFHLWTLITPANLFAVTVTGQTYWGTTMALTSGFDQYASVASGDGFSGMTFDYFTTYTPKYIEVNQNIMFMSGFSTAPSTTWFSEVGEPEFIDAEHFFEARTNDGDKVFAIKAFNNQLIIMKENSFHKLIGDSADNFQLVEISTQYGCLSNKSVVQVKQSLFWLDKKGIIEFNGASFDVVSTPVEQVFKRINIAAAKEKAVSVHHLYRNQIWFGIPVDGSSVNNLTVVYDYLIGGWTFFDGFNPASFAYIKGPLSKPTMWRGDYSGMVHYGGESFFGDSGRGISCVVLTRFENVGGENQTSLWRRFFLDVAANNSGLTGQINCQFFSDYDTSSIKATFAMYQDQFQTRAEIGVNGKAAAAQISHSSASLPLLINGYAWATRGLRNV